jgi:hypothetical protein
MLAQAILELRGSKPAPATARQYIAQLALSAEPVELTVTADGADLSGVFSVLEVMTIPLAGPNLRWAPSVDPSDDLLVAFTGASTEERQCLSARLSAGATKAPPPLMNRNAKHVLISGTFRGMRIDDNVRTDDQDSEGTTSLAREAQPLCFLVPLQPRPRGIDDRGRCRHQPAKPLDLDLAYKRTWPWCRGRTSAVISALSFFGRSEAT